jgi:hypothetical protein
LPLRTCFVCSYVVNGPFVASIAANSVLQLPAAETRDLDLQLQHVIAWRIATPAVFLTYGVDSSSTLLPVQRLSLLQQQLFASVAYSTAMEQLEGSRPALPAGASDADVTRSWGPVKEVNSPGAPRREPHGWSLLNETVVSIRHLD